MTLLARKQSLQRDIDRLSQQVQQQRDRAYLRWLRGASDAELIEREPAYIDIGAGNFTPAELAMHRQHLEVWLAAQPEE